MDNLVNAVFNNLVFDDEYDEIINPEWVRAIISQHQNDYPGAWQNWNHDVKTKQMTKMIQRAINDEEMAPARIVMFY